jgi:hypothetical protein
MHMTRHILAGIAGAALAAGLWAAAPASAAPLGTLKDAGATENLVHKTWGCHRSCELGPAGWHRHVGPYCARVACWPRAWNPHRCWVDRWGVRRCRW